MLDNMQDSSTSHSCPPTGRGVRVGPAGPNLPLQAAEMYFILEVCWDPFKRAICQHSRKTSFCLCFPYSFILIKKKAQVEGILIHRLPHFALLLFTLASSPLEVIGSFAASRQQNSLLILTWINSQEKQVRGVVLVTDGKEIKSQAAGAQWAR